MDKIQQAVATRMISSLNLEYVIQVVCQHYFVSETSLQSVSRKHGYAKIRAVIGKIVQELNVCSLTAVAKYFNRDVTGLIRTMRQLEGDSGIANEISKIKVKFNKSTSQA